jgi:hypothetical protein
VKNGLVKKLGMQFEGATALRGNGKNFARFAHMKSKRFEGWGRSTSGRIVFLASDGCLLWWRFADEICGVGKVFVANWASFGVMILWMLGGSGPFWRVAALIGAGRRPNGSCRFERYAFGWRGPFWRPKRIEL